MESDQALLQIDICLQCVVFRSVPFIFLLVFFILKTRKQKDNNKKANVRIPDLVFSFQSSVKRWFALHLTSAPEEHRSSQTTLRWHRRQLLVGIGNMVMRVAEPPQQPDVELYATIEKYDGENMVTIEQAEALCKAGHPCCYNEVTEKSYDFLHSAPLPTLQRIRKVWSPFSIRVERDRGGNQCRERPGRTKPRTLRRQVATYLVCRSKTKWMSLSSANKCQMSLVQGSTVPHSRRASSRRAVMGGQIMGAMDCLPCE